MRPTLRAGEHFREHLVAFTSRGRPHLLRPASTDLALCGVGLIDRKTGPIADLCRRCVQLLGGPPIAADDHPQG